MLYSAFVGENLTRQRRQKRLSKESRAASRSFSRKELSLWELSSISPFLESPPALSSLQRVSYRACIRCLMLFHISVKPAQIKWETAGQKLPLRPLLITIKEREMTEVENTLWSMNDNCTLMSLAFLEKH